MNTMLIDDEESGSEVEVEVDLEAAEAANKAM